MLVPLADVAPDLAVPGTGKTVRALLEGLGDTSQDVKRVGGPPAPADTP